MSPSALRIAEGVLSNPLRQITRQEAVAMATVLEEIDAQVLRDAATCVRDSHQKDREQVAAMLERYASILLADNG